MSVPTSMRVGPYAPTVLPKKRYILLYIFNFWISIIPLLIQFWFYWQFLWDYNRPIHFYIYLPLFAFASYVELVLVSIFFAKCTLTVLRILHKPRTGTFLRDVSDKDYRYWCMRNTIKRWAVWVAHKFPFPFLDNLCFKAFGVKTKFSNSLFEGWVDTEFIKFGENVVVGQASHVMASILIGNFLIIRKTIIEDDVRIGTHSVIMPGTHMKRRSLLSTWSLTTVGQVLEEGWIYHGVPARKFKKNLFFEDGLEEKIQFDVKDEESLEAIYRKFYREHQDEHVSFKEKIKAKRKIKEEEKITKPPPSYSK